MKTAQQYVTPLYSGILKVFLLPFLVGIGITTTAFSSEDPVFFSTLDPYKPAFFINSWFLENGGNERGHRNEEIVAQFSVKKYFFEGFHFGYTQKFFWQLYDYNGSAPIREINYNPEFFLDYNHQFHLDTLRIGLWEHESNGEQTEYDQNGTAVNKSRTWNRYYLHLFKTFKTAQAGMDLKVWGLYERKKDDKGSFYQDNPDIGHYLGTAELSFFMGGETARISGMVRKGWGSGTETLRLTAQSSIYERFGKKDNGVDLFLYYFSGYGESLIDYNRRVHRVGIGLTLR